MSEEKLGAKVTRMKYKAQDTAKFGMTMFKFGLLVAALGTLVFGSFRISQNLERAALDGVIVVPLEYRRDLFEIPGSGYKLQIVRLTGNETTLGDQIYKRKMLELQMEAYNRGVAMESEILQKKRKQIAEFEANEREIRGVQLRKEVADQLDIAEEDRESLNELLKLTANEP